MVKERLISTSDFLKPSTFCSVTINMHHYGSMTGCLLPSGSKQCSYSTHGSQGVQTGVGGWPDKDFCWSLCTT